MSYLNKKKFVKLKEEIDKLGFNGLEIIKFIESEGYDEFIFNASSIEIELNQEDILITADFVCLLIEKQENSYSLTVE